MRTMPLWRVLELTGDPGTGLEIGLDEYPIFDEKERLGINRLIIDQFYLRHIGMETISQFTFMMRRTMRQIMPTYNQLYPSQKLLAGRELATFDLTTVRSGKVDETAEQDSTQDQDNNSKSKSRAVNFDTPQMMLAGSKDYASSAADAFSKSEGASKTKGNTKSKGGTVTEDSSRTTGTQGSLADQLTRYRQTIINTDQLLLGDPELTSMFALIWDDTEIEPPSTIRRGIIA